MLKIKSLSLIVPAFKQEKTIVKNIIELYEVLSTLPYRFEIIVVVDGFLDKTFEKAKQLKKGNIKVFGYKENQGKGYAIKLGVEKAKGDIIGFIDAGMDINPLGIPLLLDLMKFHNAEIVIGSKLHPESKVNYPIIRTILSWGYRTLIEILFGLTIRDTQVGLKFFRAQVAKDVFQRIVVKRFAFDIEVMAVAYARGYRKIYEGPIELDFSRVKSSIGGITSVNFWKIIFLMLLDTAAVFYRLRILHYYKRPHK
jgi:glycosyltransferase involved in cell wall biosynthesis